jgi:hypothetical protein
MRASPIVRVRQALLGLYMKRYSAASPPTIEAIERQYQSFLCLPEPESWSIGTPPQFMRTGIHIHSSLRTRATKVMRGWLISQ